MTSLDAQTASKIEELFLLCVEQHITETKMRPSVLMIKKCHTLSSSTTVPRQEDLVDAASYKMSPLCKESLVPQYQDQILHLNTPEFLSNVCIVEVEGNPLYSGKCQTRWTSTGLQQSSRFMAHRKILCQSGTVDEEEAMIIFVCRRNLH